MSTTTPFSKSPSNILGSLNNPDTAKEIIKEIVGKYGYNFVYEAACDARDDIWAEEKRKSINSQNSILGRRIYKKDRDLELSD